MTKTKTAWTTTGLMAFTAFFYGCAGAERQTKSPTTQSAVSDPAPGAAGGDDTSSPRPREAEEAAPEDDEAYEAEEKSKPQPRPLVRLHKEPSTVGESIERSADEAVVQGNRDAEPADETPFAMLTVLDDNQNREMYFRHYGTNPTIETRAENTSTFSIDVDTASYSMARAFLTGGRFPHEQAIRVEEFINAFDYGYEASTAAAFSVQAEAFPSRNRPGFHVLHIGLKGKEVKKHERKAANLVFVIDVSGSMNMDNRLGLVKRALRLLVDELDGRDAVSIVAYGSRAHTILAPTLGSDKQTILAAINALQPSGATNAQAGLEIGYKLAAQRAEPGTVSRVILCSDGVANTGLTQASSIFARVKREADQGVTISTVGFGMGNYNDVLMEKLADNGNGNYAYVDRIAEARRIFVEQMTGTLQVIAKDVKIQVSFDPQVVARYRLLGYENRVLKNRDFNNDAVDAGEIGAGHSVTAMYEVKFRDRPTDFGTLRIRYKQPDGKTSRLIERELPGRIVKSSYRQITAPTRLSLVAAGFAEKLRGSYWARNLSYDDLLAMHEEIGAPFAGRPPVEELEQLIKKAQRLDQRNDKFEAQVPLAQMSFDRVPVLQ